MQYSNYKILTPKDEEGYCTEWDGISAEDWSYMPEARRKGWIEKEDIKSWQSPLDLASFTRVWDDKLEKRVAVSESGMWEEVQRPYKEQH